MILLMGAVTEAGRMTVYRVSPENGLKRHSQHCTLAHRKKGMCHHPLITQLRLYLIKVEFQVVCCTLDSNPISYLICDLIRGDFLTWL